MEPTVFDRLWDTFLEPATSVLVAGVAGLLTLASYRSQCFSSSLQKQVALEAESSVLTLYAAVFIPLFGSIMLLVLFYFLNIVFYFLVVLFGLSSGMATMLFVQPTVQFFRRKALPRLGEEQTLQFRGVFYRQPFFDLGISFFFAVGMIVGWLVSRHWVFVDVLAIGMAVEAIKTLRLPSLMVATILLSVFLAYDIFWVFISPLIFNGRSVMVDVAVGVMQGSIPLPMLILIPKFLHSGEFGLLGLGDIVLPGLLLSYLFRADYALLKRARGENRIKITPVQVLALGGYFIPVLFSYVFGLILTLTALAILQMGQPALLYLVPCTLGTTLLLAFRRGNFREMWKGTIGENQGHHEQQEEEESDGDFELQPLTAQEVATDDEIVVEDE